MGWFGIFCIGTPKGGGGLGGEAGALDGRERHAGSSVARGKGVVGGRAFVFNGKWGNVEVTGGDGLGGSGELHLPSGGMSL